MTTLTTITGKTENEIKALYLSMIDVMVEMGATEDQARKIARESFRESVL